MSTNASFTNKLGRSYSRGKPLSLEMRQRVIQMLEAGKTPIEVSNELKITSVTVSRWYKRYVKYGSLKTKNHPRDSDGDMSVKLEDGDDDDLEEESSTCDTEDSSTEAPKTEEVYEGTSDGATRQMATSQSTEAAPSSSSPSVNKALNGVGHLQRLQLAANKRTIKRLSQRSSLNKSIRKQANASSRPRRSLLLPAQDDQSPRSSARTAQGYRSLRNFDLPRADRSPEAQSNIQLRESPLSPPPPPRRLDVPISDHRCPITLVINPPPMVMGQPQSNGPTTSSSSSSTSDQAYPSQPGPYPSKIIIEIRFA